MLYDHLACRAPYAAHHFAASVTLAPDSKSGVALYAMVRSRTARECEKLGAAR